MVYVKFGMFFFSSFVNEVTILFSNFYSRTKKIRNIIEDIFVDGSFAKKMLGKVLRSCKQINYM